MKATFGRSMAVALSLAVMLAAVVACEAAAAPVRVLVLSGRNNHDWKTTTPALVKIFEEGGRFKVDVIEDPAVMDAAMLARYDVIVSNWSGFPDMDGRQWGEKAEKAFLDFIGGGKGFVLFHAASATLRTWPEYQQLAGAAWGKDTGHGRIHAFRVKVTDASHPITRGLKDFVITDELWHRMQAHPDRHVLCAAVSSKDEGGSGQDEPVVFSTQLGKGRGLNIVLGHDTNTMQNVAWQTLMRRAAEWAATGEVTIPIPAAWPAAPAGGAAAAADVDAALAKIAAYTFGKSRADLGPVEQLTYAAASDPALRATLAAALTKMLASDATLDCRRFLCDQLGLIGSDAEVPALAALLADKDLATAARSALARIPGDAALAAMRAATEKTAGLVLVGLVNTLGDRRDAKAVEAIAGRLADADAVVAAAAIDALGKIGGPAAARALAGARGKVAPPLKPVLANALLLSAEGLLASGNAAEAADIYRQLSAAEMPAYIRTAAFPGLVACQKDKAAEMLEAALTSKDPALQSAAIRCARTTGDKALTTILAAQLPKLPAEVQVQMIEALADRGDPAALPAVTKMASAEAAPVRLAALAALGRLGNADTVALLAGLAAKATGAEQRIIRASLARLPGDAIDPAMIRLVGEGDASVRREVMAAFQQRGSRAAVPALLRAAEDADPAVAADAVKALGELADPKDGAAILALLKKSRPAPVLAEVQTALVSLSRRTGSAEATVAAVIAEMPQVGAAGRASLLRVLGRLGGEKALTAVRGALKDEDAGIRDVAIRALAEWPDGAALGDLLGVARSAADVQAKVLALRGFARLAGEASGLKPEQLAPLFAEAMPLAARPEEKKVLLGAMAKVPCVETMRLAAGSLADAALRDEAGLAVVQIAEAVWRYHVDEAKAAVRRVLEAVETQAVKDRAAAIVVAMSKPVNLAIGAAASSPDDLDGDGDARGDQAAIDGDPATYWDEVDGQKLYRLCVTLKAPVEVSAVSIVGFQHHQFAPKDFEVLCDGKVVKTVEGAAYDENRLIVTFAPVRCTTVELKITGYYGGSPAIRELEIYRVDPSAAK